MTVKAGDRMEEVTVKVVFTVPDAPDMTHDRLITNQSKQLGRNNSEAVTTLVSSSSVSESSSCDVGGASWFS